MCDLSGQGFSQSQLPANRMRRDLVVLFCEAKERALDTKREREAALGSSTKLTRGRNSSSGGYKPGDIGFDYLLAGYYRGTDLIFMAFSYPRYGLSLATGEVEVPRYCGKNLLSI